MVRIHLRLYLGRWRRTVENQLFETLRTLVDYHGCVSRVTRKLWDGCYWSRWRYCQQFCGLAEIPAALPMHIYRLPLVMPLRSVEVPQGYVNRWAGYNPSQGWAQKAVDERQTAEQLSSSCGTDFSQSFSMVNGVVLWCPIFPPMNRAYSMRLLRHQARSIIKILWLRSLRH